MNRTVKGRNRTGNRKKCRLGTVKRGLWTVKGEERIYKVTEGLSCNIVLKLDFPSVFTGLMAMSQKT